MSSWCAYHDWRVTDTPDAVSWHDWADVSYYEHSRFHRLLSIVLPNQQWKNCFVLFSLYGYILQVELAVVKYAALSQLKIILNISEIVEAIARLLSIFPVIYSINTDSHQVLCKCRTSETDCDPSWKVNAAFCASIASHIYISLYHWYYF